MEAGRLRKRPDGPHRRLKQNTRLRCAIAMDNASKETAGVERTIRRGRVGGRRRRWMLVAVLCTVLASVGAAGVLPRVSGEAAPRTGWYFSSGQWRADLRTVAAAVHYMFQQEAGN